MLGACPDRVGAGGREDERKYFWVGSIEDVTFELCLQASVYPVDVEE